MTQDETIQVLRLLKTNYPQSFKDWTKEQAKNFLTLWANAFKNVPVELVLKAIETILYTDVREFAPNIAQVNMKIKELITTDTEFEATETWNALLEHLSKVGRDDFSEEDARAISPYLLDVYPLGQLKTFATMDYTSLEFERSRFEKSYRSTKRNKQLELMQAGKLMQIAEPEKLQALGLSNLKMIGE